MHKNVVSRLRFSKIYGRKVLFIWHTVINRCKFNYDVHFFSVLTRVSSHLLFQMLLTIRLKDYLQSRKSRVFLLILHCMNSGHFSVSVWTPLYLLTRRVFARAFGDYSIDGTYINWNVTWNKFVERFQANFKIKFNKPYNPSNV